MHSCVAAEACVCVGCRARSHEVDFTGEVEVGYDDGRLKSGQDCFLGELQAG